MHKACVFKHVTRPVSEQKHGVHSSNLTMAATDYLQQQGNTLVVIEPGDEYLAIGLGSRSSPVLVPHCIAYLDKRKAAAKPQDQWDSSSQGLSAWCSTPPAQAALQQACQVLYIPTPDEAATAALSVETKTEGSDGHTWTDTRPVTPWPPPPAATAAAGAMSGGEGGVTQPLKPFVVGGEVEGLPPGAPYTTWWPLQQRRLSGAGTLPAHLLRGWLADLWGTALEQELGLGRAALRGLGAVLLLPESMPAQEVCLLADVLLCDLGFTCMVAHLSPVAASFGANTSTACVVTVGTSVTSVTCVEDGLLVAGKTLLQLGVADVGRVLLAWLSWQGVWPEGLQPGRSAYERSVMVDLLHTNCYCPPEGTDVGLIGQPMLEDLGPAQIPLRSPGSPTLVTSVTLRPWDAIAPLALFLPDLAPPSEAAAAAQAVQQDRGTAAGAAAAAGAPAAGHSGGSVLNGGPAAADGHANSNGAAAAAAAAAAGGGGAPSAMDIDQPTGAGAAPHPSPAPHPAPAPAAAVHPQQTRQRSDGRSSRLSSHILPVSPSAWGVDQAALLGTTAAAGIDTGAATAPHGSSSSSSLGPPASSSIEASQTLSSNSRREGYQRYHALVEDRSAVEAAYLAAQHKMRSGGASGGGVGVGGGGDGGEAVLPPPPVSAYLPEAAEPVLQRMGLDEAVASLIRAAGTARPELQQRLAAGVLLVGEGAELSGLARLLERRVRQQLAATPETAALPVAVLEPPAPLAASEVIWKGGALLGALDAARDNWVLAKQWVEGGAAAGQLARQQAALDAAAAAAAAVEASGGGSAGEAGATAVNGDAAAAAAAVAAAVAARRLAPGVVGRAGGGDLAYAKLFYYLKAQQGAL